MSRSQLNKASQIPFRYVYQHDRAWLDDKFPKRKERDKSATREGHRDSAKAFFKTPGATRADFKRSNEAAEAWLMRKDADWFRALVAQSTTGEQQGE